jgi:hypothetical protein
MIVIGGEIGSSLGPYLLPAIEKSFKLHTNYFKEVQLVLSTLGPLAAAIGAAAYVFS